MFMLDHILLACVTKDAITSGREAFKPKTQFIFCLPVFSWHFQSNNSIWDIDYILCQSCGDDVLM